jgi:hypothetical protein
MESIIIALVALVLTYCVNGYLEVSFGRTLASLLDNITFPGAHAEHSNEWVNPQTSCWVRTLVWSYGQVAHVAYHKAQVELEVNYCSVPTKPTTWALSV